MFQIRSLDGAVNVRAKNPDALESLVRMNQKDGRRFQVDLLLDIPLTAVVMRHEGEPDTVYLASKGRTVGLTRHTFDNPGGDLGVSCNPQGKTVEVTTINVEFRPITDRYTDRGLVWVTPGEPAVAFFFLNGEALNLSGLVRDIGEAAAKAVEQKVLKHFVTPTETKH